MKKGMGGAALLLTGVVGGAVTAGKTMGKKLEQEKQLSEKHLSLFLMMNQWVKIKQEGKCLVSYFEKNGYRKIAVYGMSYAGETLLDELRETDIEVVYGIDRNAANLYAEIDIMSIDDSMDKVDAVVVTAIAFFDEIKEKLSAKMNCPIISLEDILYDI